MPMREAAIEFPFFAGTSRFDCLTTQERNTQPHCRETLKLAEYW